LSAHTVSVGQAMPVHACTAGSSTLTANVGHSQQVAAASTQSLETWHRPRPGPTPPPSLPSSALDGSAPDELKHPATSESRKQAMAEVRTGDEEQSTSCARV
jgi:hypothetical protein